MGEHPFGQTQAPKRLYPAYLMPELDKLTSLQ